MAGDVPSGDLGRHKVMDQRGFAEVTAGYFVPLRKAGTAGEDVQHAFRYAVSGRGPAVFNVAEDILRQDYPGEFKYRALAIMPGPFPPPPNQEAVEQATGILATARRPLILAGRGAVLSGARLELEALSSRIGALLSTSLLGQGMFQGHPMNIGLIGDLATDVTVELLARSDCVLVVGASLNPNTTGGGPLAPKATVIQIDQDPSRFNEWNQIDLAVQGDAKATVAEINKLLETAGISERPSFWSSEPMQATIQASRRWPPPPAEQTGRALHPGTFFAAFDKIFPANRTLVQASGCPGGLRAGSGHYTLPYITVPSAEAMLRVGNFGSIGLGLGVGIGAAMARPDTHCVTFEGDGSFMMNIQELDTAVRYHFH